MIFDTLDEWERYAPVHPGVAAALRTLRQADLPTRADGRYELDGDRLVAIVQRYDTKPAETCIWESHRRYIDVQFIAAGVEAMGHRPIGVCRERVGYDAAKDVTFFHPPAAGEPATRIVVAAGSFAVFFPHDVHSPMIAPLAPAAVTKVVLKVAVG